jgi:hypothetical protein
VEIHQRISTSKSIYFFKPTNLEKFKEFLEGEYERTKDDRRI